jgi:predicted anti-sigma-YlaC factor YlaD
MMSCKEMTHLMSQQMDRDLYLRERIALRFHLMMCSGCRNFEQNMLFLRQAAQQARDSLVGE